MNTTSERSQAVWNRFRPSPGLQGAGTGARQLALAVVLVIGCPLGFLSFGAERVPPLHVSQGQWPNDTAQENQTKLTGADRVRGKIGNEDADLKMTPEDKAATAASASGTGKAGSTSRLKSDPARLARILQLRCRRLPGRCSSTHPKPTPSVRRLRCSPLTTRATSSRKLAVAPQFGCHHGRDRREKPLRSNADMGFVLVPPGQTRVEVKIVEYPGESDAGPFPVPDNMPIEGWPGGISA